jgi:hypothetical protein
MLSETTKWHEVETGGMMFGRISESQSDLKIDILRTYVPPDESCIRKRSYFEIDPMYAKKVLNSEQLLYLGNWHKHLGYGGPSGGDQHQIADFFVNNPHLDTVVTFILDFYSEQEYNLFIEVYIRRNIETEAKSQLFQTFRVLKENIIISSEEGVPPLPIKGITKEKLTVIKEKMVSVYDGMFSAQDVNEFVGQTQDEKIISFPYQFKIIEKEESRTLDLLVVLSFPPEFPEGKIYMDISSRDMSINITFDTHPAGTLNDDELIEPFLLLLKAKLEDDVPPLIKKPLWKIMLNHTE